MLVLDHNRGTKEKKMENEVEQEVVETFLLGQEITDMLRKALEVVVNVWKK